MKNKNGLTQHDKSLGTENGVCRRSQYITFQLVDFGRISDTNVGFKVTYYPEWFPINDHLSLYQRHPTPQIWTCMKLSCKRNSECACMWSHFLCLLMTVQALWLFMQESNVHFVHPDVEKTLFAFSLICGCVCFGCSCLFHMFYCHSQSYFESTLKLDLVGIVVGTQGAWHPWLYYTFYCEKRLWFVFAFVTALCGIVSSWLLTRPNLLRECMAKERAIISGSIFVLVIPIYFMVFLRDGFVAAVIDGHQCWGMFAIIVGFVGVSVYCTKIPESLFSGWYDNIITSHVIFHFFAALCFWLSFYMSMLLQEQRFQLGNNCSK